MFENRIQEREAACREQIIEFHFWRELCVNSLSCIDGLQFEYKNTNYLIWHKSCLELFIYTIKLHVERHTGVY
jgi:hypothetical protein